MPGKEGFRRKSVLTSAGVLEDPAVRAPEEAHPDKYEVTARIGSGGMGEVLLVEDRDLRRQIAVKLLLPQQASSPAHRVKFVAEAQATSQLEHPGIPPVHDLGVTEDGRPYFTMKLVRGRTLREVLRDLLLGRNEIRQEYTLHRLITVMERVCECVHFAHERGVLHRDLKPENIMLGDYGEVHVMDWGIARVHGADVDEESRVDTATVGAELATRYGTLKGTIPYMSPEQAAGRTDEMDRRSDVYALGCILYEILTLHMAFEGEAPIQDVIHGRVPPVRTRNPRRPVPEDLAELCDRAMARSASSRPASARDLGARFRAWLDGRSERERRRREADALAAKGRDAAARYRTLVAELESAERSSDDEARAYKPWQPVSEKRALLALNRRVKELRLSAVLAFDETTKLLEAALVAEEKNESARGALAELWKERLAVAEERGQFEVAAQALRMVERYDDGHLAAVLRGDGTLDLTSEPSGAEVTIQPFVEADGVLAAGEAKPLGATPLVRVALPMGSYLCILRRPGYRDVRYPVHITRNRHWTGHVTLRGDRQIGAEFVLVPGGPFRCGSGRDLVVAELPDFAIQRSPVTFHDYALFLRALDAERGAEATAPRVPGTAGDGPFMERGTDGTWHVKDGFVDEKAHARCLSEHGSDYVERLPVVGVSFDDAVAYCEWKSRASGRQWRLPSAQEREKAARGVDGRAFPWGDLEDASLGKCRDSRDEPSQPEPVGTFPSAVSVYGMADAAGNAWDWTTTWLDDRRVLRVVKGGAWGVAITLLRCDTHNVAYDPSIRLGNIGFRCARDL